MSDIASRLRNDYGYSEYGETHIPEVCLEAADEIDRLQAEVKKLREERAVAKRPHWRPIETAPKDGTRILAWTKDWLAPLTVSYYGTRWSYTYEAVLRHQPTHWMFLPLPPKTDATRKAPT